MHGEVWNRSAKGVIYVVANDLHSPISSMYGGLLEA